VNNRFKITWGESLIIDSHPLTFHGVTLVTDTLDFFLMLYYTSFKRNAQKKKTKINAWQGSPCLSSTPAFGLGIIMIALNNHSINPLNQDL